MQTNFSSRDKKKKQIEIIVNKSIIEYRDKKIKTGNNRQDKANVTKTKLLNITNLILI